MIKNLHTANSRPTTALKGSWTKSEDSCWTREGVPRWARYCIQLWGSYDSFILVPIFLAYIIRLFGTFFVSQQKHGTTYVNKANGFYVPEELELIDNDFVNTVVSLIAWRVTLLLCKQCLIFNMALFLFALQKKKPYKQTPFVSLRTNLENNLNATPKGPSVLFWSDALFIGFRLDIKQKDNPFRVTKSKTKAEIV